MSEETLLQFINNVQYNFIVHKHTRLLRNEKTEGESISSIRAIRSSYNSKVESRSLAVVAKAAESWKNKVAIIDHVFGVSLKHTDNLNEEMKFHKGNIYLLM